MKQLHKRHEVSHNLGHVLTRRVQYPESLDSTTRVLSEVSDEMLDRPHCLILECDHPGLKSNVLSLQLVRKEAMILLQALPKLGWSSHALSTLRRVLIGVITVRMIRD